jgi:O-acetyl-ADP-ribose deacetylase (regulator of RNase III)
MIRLDAITVYHNGEPRRVELYQGDLTELSAAEAVDVLVISAFPNCYAPVAGSMIEALLRKGIDVDELAADRAFDLRDSFSCWLSDEVTPPPGADGVRFRRLLCFEPHWRGMRRHPSQAVEELYQALAPFLGGSLRLSTVAMPLLACGSLGCEVEAMVEPMVDGALRWMLSGAPLRAVRIACYDAADAERALAVVRRLRERYATHDVFISYCHQDAARVVPFCAGLRSRLPHLRLFRDADNLKPGLPKSVSGDGAAACFSSFKARSGNRFRTMKASGLAFSVRS